MFNAKIRTETGIEAGTNEASEAKHALKHEKLRFLNQNRIEAGKKHVFEPKPALKPDKLRFLDQNPIEAGKIRFLNQHRH